MKRLLLTVWGLVLLFSAAWGITAQEEQQIIDQALAAVGKAPFELSDTVPVHRLCGTSVIMDAKQRFGEFSAKTQALLSPLLFARPTTQTSYAPSSGRFRIHYDTSGSGAVRNVAIDVNLNGVPDWVDTLGFFLDSIWNKEVIQLGFRAPVSDSFYSPNGGDGRRDIYLIELGGSFLGYTAPDSAGGVLGNRATAFVVLDNDYAGISGYTDPDGPRRAIRVTAAHEFFHAIQFAYNAFGAEFIGGSVRPYWYEATAVWMEDQMYDEINDYLQYLPFWFRHPELSFRTFTSNFSDLDRALHPYALAIYGHYLSTRLPSYPVIRRVWESMSTVGGFDLFRAIDSSLGFAGFMPGAAYPQRFMASLREFHRWNYFVGGKVPLNAPDTLYGAESSTWPTFDKPSLSDPSHVDTTDVYPTRFPKPYAPCQSCPPSVIAFFCAPCSTIAGLPCLTDCAPVCPFVPYQLSNPVCINDVEDLGASYLTLQNVNTSRLMIFDLIADTRNRVPWFAAGAGYELAFRAVDFLTSGTTDPAGQINEFLFDDIGNYDEVVVAVVNDTLLPAGAARRSSTYAYSVTDSSIPPAVTRIFDPRPNPFRPGKTAKAFFPVDLDSLSGDWEVSLTIFSPSGEIVYMDKKALRGGVSHETKLGWTGENESGEPVASGVYFCKVTMNEAGQSRKVEKVLKIALIRQ